MKAAPMIDRPDFPLMTLTEVQSFHHMQMPRWLFFDGRYRELPLEAKVAYTFILNRHQLSRLNGWVNDEGEVFIVYPRQALAQEMQISYRKCIEAFKELVIHRLIWERRCGQGSPNQIYLARMESVPGKPDYESAPFVTQEGEAERLRSAKDAPLEEEYNGAGACAAGEEMPVRQAQTCRDGISRPAVRAGLDVPGPHTSHKEKNNPDRSSTDVSQSVTGSADAEKQELHGIFECCDLWVLPEEAHRPIRDAIERLFYSDSYRIGPTLLPRDRVREKLRRLDGVLLQNIYGKLTINTTPVKNSLAYIMAVVLNSISENEGDLLVDPYLNGLREGTGGYSTGPGYDGRR